jgi:hypothetical protein
MTRARNTVLRSAWAWLVWAAVLMLAAQPVSAAAMAQPQGQTLVVEVCSSHSAGKSIAIQLPGDPAQTSDCNKCPSCLTAPTLAQAAAPAAVSRAIAYERFAFASERDVGVALARFPPRPPGQGPPALPNA